MSKDTGGPAFPVADVCHASGQIEYGGEGMTLRDYAAIKAMAAFIVSLGDGSGLPIGINDERLAERSYEIADQMLFERAK